MNSKQGSRYIKRRMGNDLKRQILVHNGIISEDEMQKKSSVLTCLLNLLLGLNLWCISTLMILRIITDSITIYSTTIWISKFRDKDTLNKLIAHVFTKLSS